jgi:glycosyltransferase involved in cell wall biosynthesis
MKILFSLTYYHPHISGLTIYAQRLAEALVTRGHQVTVLTSQHNAELPRENKHEGVHIVRVPVSFRLGKGPVMPSYILTASSLLRQHDITVLNLPNTPIETLSLVIAGRLLSRRPLVAIYQCDMQLPDGILSRLVEKMLFAVNAVGGLCFDRIVSITEDYADHSRFLRWFKRKREIIPPAVIMPTPNDEAVKRFRQRVAPGGERLIGFPARFATEKGVEYMLAALPLIHAQMPRAKLLFTMDPESVIGEEQYWNRMQPLIARVREHCEFLGTLPRQQLPAFYAGCDVVVLPSINSTEGFGLVQLESMLSGTPVVATNLPGVRVPVQKTGMGHIVAPRDAAALAEAVVDVIQNRQSYVKAREEIEKHFPFERSVDQYEKLLQSLL